MAEREGLLGCFAPSPLRGRPSGVIPASLPSPLTDPNLQKFTYRMAEREGLLGAARLVPSLRFGTAVARAPASLSQPTCLYRDSTSDCFPEISSRLAEREGFEPSKGF